MLSEITHDFGKYHRRDFDIFSAHIAQRGRKHILFSDLITGVKIPHFVELLSITNIETFENADCGITAMHAQLKMRFNLNSRPKL